MAQKQQIHYSHAGLQPPVFIAGSMCEPQWEPIEMTHKKKEDGELDFQHEFRAEPGEYQYKFRLGPGDWWVLDESKPTIDDGTGNRNNLIVVEPKPQEPTLQTTQEEGTSAAAHVTDAQAKEAAPVAGVEEEEDDADVDIPESEKNLFRHETIQVANGTGESDNEDEHVEIDKDDQDEQPPLFEHEAAPSERVDSQHVTPFKSDKFTFYDPAEHAIEADDDFADDERETLCPLFRHETGAASDVDPDEAPLFRHESMSPNDSMSPSSFSPASRKQRKLDLEDVNDPSLEPFPVDEAGIQARIQRVATRHREDEVVFEGTPPSPSLAQTKGFSLQAPPTLPRNDSGDLSHLDAIDETEETDEADYTPADKPVEKKDSVVQPNPINIKVQDVSELDSNPSFADVSDVSNRGPPTPPMTPIEHGTSKAAPHDGAADSHDVSARVGSPRSRKDNATDHIANRPSPSEMAKPAEKPSKESAPENSIASNICAWFIGLCGGKGRAAGVAIAMSVAAAAFAMNTRSA